MEESKLYTARVRVVQAMEQRLSWHEAASRGTTDQPIHGLSAPSADASRRRASAAGRETWAPDQTAGRGPHLSGRNLSATPQYP